MTSATVPHRLSSTKAQAAAMARLRALPGGFKVTRDAEGWPVIRGRRGQIEWCCDGVDCHACPLPGQFALGVWTDRHRLFDTVWAIPGVRRHQTGDQEMRAVFPPEALAEVAKVIRARRKRTQTSPQSLANLRPRATSGAWQTLSSTRPVFSYTPAH